MGYHVVAFFENQDGGGTLQPLAALADTLSQIWPRDANADFLKPSDPHVNVYGIFAGIDATVQPRARLVAASFREQFRAGAYEIPQLSSTVEPGSPPAFNDLRFRPLRLKAGELVSVETLNNPAGAVDQYVILFVGDGIQVVDPKGGRWVRAITTAAAMTADVWNSRTIAFDENLDAGRYEVLGMRAISTSLIAARLAFNNQVHKPGVLGADTRTDVPDASFGAPGAWGKLGEFHTDAPPAVEFLVDAADNEVQVVDLYLRQTSSK